MTENETTEATPFETALAQLQPGDAEIAAIKEQYLQITVAGVDDQAGYGVAHKALMHVVKMRTTLDKMRLAAGSDARKFIEQVNTRAKELFAQLEPIEDHLKRQKAVVDDERKRLEQLAADRKVAERKALLDGRFAKLRACNSPLSPWSIEMLSDEEFEAVLEEAQRLDAAKRAEREAAEQAAAHAREEREAEERAKRERDASTNSRLREVWCYDTGVSRADVEDLTELEFTAFVDKARTLHTERQAAIKAEQDRLAAERKALDDDRERLRAEQVERDRIQKIADDKRAADAKREQEQLREEQALLDRERAAIQADRKAVADAKWGERVRRAKELHLQILEGGALQTCSDEEFAGVLDSRRRELAEQKRKHDEALAEQQRQIEEQSRFAKLDAERVAEEKRQRAEALRPVRERLNGFANIVSNMRPTEPFEMGLQQELELVMQRAADEIRRLVE